MDAEILSIDRFDDGTSCLHASYAQSCLFFFFSPDLCGKKVQDGPLFGIIRTTAQLTKAARIMIITWKTDVVR
jgi:hypothetical protein